MSEYRPPRFEKDEYEDEYPMAARMDRIRAFDPEKRAAHLHVFRGVMTAVGYFRQCPRKGCRRARKCVGPRADCAWARLPYLQRYIIPELDRCAAARLEELEARGEE